MTSNRLFVSCAVCNHDLPRNNYISLKSNNLHSKKCKYCSTVFIVNSPINIDNAANFYTMDAYKGNRDLQDTNLYSGYYDNCFSGYNKNDMTIIQFIRILNNITKLNNGEKNKLKLLDVGCATGVFLDLARSMNFEVMGVEISRELSDYAKINFDLNIVDSIYSIKANNLFDVITLNDVIEHIPHNELKNLMDKISSLLKSNGCLVIRTPVENSLLRNLAKLSYYFTFKRVELLLHLFYSFEHLINFSEKSLSILGKNYGFKVIKISREEENPNRLNIGIIAKITLHFLYIISSTLSLQHKNIIYYRKSSY